MPKESTCHLAGWLFLFTGVLGTIGLCLALYKIRVCTVQDQGLHCTRSGPELHKMGPGMHKMGPEMHKIDPVLHKMKLSLHKMRPSIDHAAIVNRS